LCAVHHFYEQCSFFLCQGRFYPLSLVNVVHELENHMFKKIVQIATALTLSGTMAIAGSSTQHSARASNHSAAAASHGSAAVVSGAATVAAVPLMVVGATLSLSGAALQSAGNGAMTAGSQIIESLDTPVTLAPAPDGPPTLDGTYGAKR
jgi:hypothetical protein